jgi:hypothetical protein
MKHNLILICFIAILLSTPITAIATDYHVGQGQTYVTIGAVPWYTLKAGDTVYIHPGTYHEKFLLSTRGTVTNPIRVLGVLDGNGNRPIIDGQNATTSTNNHFHWQDVSGNAVIQWLGVVFISINSDDAPLPAYIQIKNLEIMNGYETNNFTAENGTTVAYDSFSAGLYIRSAQHILIENCVIHDNALGIYNWTGSGADWWDGLAQDIIIRGNYFYNNGLPNSYTEHQTYTEADGVIIEYNHYGPLRPGAWGSHLKDRSAGTIIRYNYFDSAPDGWVIDLVEPENSWDALGASIKYNQAFVYGNILINNGNYEPNYIHWNEDHQMGRGRATKTGGKLFFYDNTILTIANQDDVGYDVPSSVINVFNETWGGYDCPTDSLPGVIDVRNNIFSILPRTAGQPVPVYQFSYCSDNQNLNFGVNWVSPGWVINSNGTGTGNLYAPSANNPGFVNSSSPYDLHLSSSSDAINKGGASAPEMTSNYLGLNLTPIAQYRVHQALEDRSGLTSLGAFEYSPGSPPLITHTVTPSAAVNGSITPSSPQTVNHASTAQFSVTPNSGYTATVGGTCGGNLSGTTYTTNAITADCTVSATFSLATSLLTHTVTPSASANGSITPSSPQTVNHASTVQFTVTPNSGYTTAVGGTCGGYLSGTTYTTNAVNADCSVNVTFVSGTKIPSTPTGVGVR